MNTVYNPLMFAPQEFILLLSLLPTELVSPTPYQHSYHVDLDHWFMSNLILPTNF